MGLRPENDVNLKYWEIQQNVGGWFWIVAPVMQGRKQLTFKEVSGLYRELKKFEKNISHDFKGWISNTKIENAHIQHAFRKLGAKPFEIDKYYIWFRREVKKCVVQEVAETQQS